MTDQQERQGDPFQECALLPPRSAHKVRKRVAHFSPWFNRNAQVRTP
jgi:hypothetical protein